MCMPSSREISSFENVSPGIRPRFLSQKIDAKEPAPRLQSCQYSNGAASPSRAAGSLPEKKMPSTAANATRRSANVTDLSSIQRRAQSALPLMQGTAAKARNRGQTKSREQSLHAKALN